MIVCQETEKYKITCSSITKVPHLAPSCCKHTVDSLPAVQTALAPHYCIAVFSSPLCSLGTSKAAFLISLTACSLHGGVWVSIWNECMCGERRWGCMWKLKEQTLLHLYNIKHMLVIQPSSRRLMFQGWTTKTADKKLTWWSTRLMQAAEAEAWGWKSSLKFLLHEVKFVWHKNFNSKPQEVLQTSVSAFEKTSLGHGKDVKNPFILALQWTYPKDIFSASAETLKRCLLDMFLLSGWCFFTFWRWYMYFLLNLLSLAS